MTRINDLTASVYSSDTPSSLQLWGVWNAKDYRVPVSNLSGLVGRARPALVVNSNFGVNNASGTLIPWSSAQYDPDGWWSSNSNTILRVPNGRITYVRFRVSLAHGYVNEAAYRILKNSNLTTPNLIFQKNPPAGSYNYQGTWMTPTVACQSGDRFEVQRFFGTSSLIANPVNAFQAIPETFAQ